jgi:type IV pilus assembly protein PilB
MKHKVLPFETVEGQPDKLVVVTPNPADRDVYHVGRSFPYKRYEICYMREQDWSEYFRKLTLEKQKEPHLIEPLRVVEEEEGDIDSALEGEINRGHLIAMVENIFSDAVRVGASDIHIVPEGVRKTDIFFRVDGQLSRWYSIEDARAEAVVAVVKGRGLNLDRFERMTAQDAAGQKMIDNRLIRFRFSVLPVVSNEMGGKLESVVIRILKDADASLTVERIGFDSYSMRVFQEAISKPFGLIILTGPTGSGKSTTLSAALRSVMKPEMNTITVEDPVEYILPGARQVKLNTKLTFENAMRAILRHDPDIVMVGEIRDRITADIAIQLSNTGHLTFSTLHTNDAPSAVARLFKMGVEPFLLAQALNIVVAQRLVRKLCEGCKEPDHNVNEILLTRAGLTVEEIAQVQFFKPVGCANCIGGYKGRTAIHESLYMTSEIRGIIFDSGEKIDKEAIRQASLRDGMQTLRQSGMRLVKSGVTTLEEVLSNTTND